MNYKENQVKKEIGAIITDFQEASKNHESAIAVVYENFKKDYETGHFTDKYVEERTHVATAKADESFAQAASKLNTKLLKLIGDLRSDFISSFNGTAPDPQNLSNCLQFIRLEGEEIKDDRLHSIICDCGCNNHMDTLRLLRRTVELQRRDKTMEYSNASEVLPLSFGQYNHFQQVLSAFDDALEIAKDLFLRKKVRSNTKIIAYDIQRNGFIGEYHDREVMIPKHTFYVPMLSYLELMGENSLMELADRLDKMIATYIAEVKGE